ncbi:MAG: hypothetical protein KY459_01010 [Acidobacteria bacterium]|nr:hypothetical protein [Acidobacteriota bacterium]
MTQQSLAERKESLWRLIASPTIWAAHFMLCYVTAAIWCAKYVARTGTLEPIRWAILVFTAVALVGIAWNGWDGYRRHRFGDAHLPHDDDTPADRRRFLGFATMLLAGLSGVAVIYAAFVAIVFRSCR